MEDVLLYEIALHLGIEVILNDTSIINYITILKIVNINKKI